MGCWISTIQHQEKKETKQSQSITFDGDYVSIISPTRGLVKRLWTTRSSSASSSGASSDFTTPKGKTSLNISRFNSYILSEEETPIKRPIETSNTNLDPTYQNVPEILKNVPLDIALEDAQTSQERRTLEAIYAILDESDCYNTESSSSESSTSLCSELVYTQSIDTNMDSTASTDFELDMELNMVGKVYGIMPKTSSPILQQRKLSLDSEITKFINKSPSESYHKWRTYLHTTPAYAHNNVTRIPEAIAGHFCPTYDFPGFSDLKTSKYIKPPFRESMFYENQDNATESIIVDLPVATITTEL